MYKCIHVSSEVYNATMVANAGHTDIVYDEYASLFIIAMLA